MIFNPGVLTLPALTRMFAFKPGIQRQPRLKCIPVEYAG